jgi:ZIP family zinc transporter
MPNPNELNTALGWGAISSGGLVIGALAGSFGGLSHRTIALTMSVGAGILLAAASIELTVEAVRTGGSLSTAILLLVGATLFSVVNAMLTAFGAANRKRCGDCAPQPSESQQPGSGMAIALGTALDAVPEALVLGLALHDASFPLELVMAIAVGNLPEALSGSAGMRSAGRSHRYVLVLWTAIAIGTAVLTAVGYGAVDLLNQSWPPRLQAFGAGALVAMTAETMIPEAFHDSPRYSGLLAAIGFSALLLI